MPAILNKDAIEIGIVVSDAERSLTFYRDVIGLPYLGDLVFPGAHMWRFGAGSSVVKLLEHDPAPVLANPRTDDAVVGFRYMSFFVSNLEEVVAECEAFGSRVPIPVTAFGDAVKFAFVEDPDGNRIELLDLKE
jgi:catechol 2,3-dioxygenase-like lactoylglutathione lyase family enzyme